VLPHLAIEERNADETTRGYEPKVSNGLESLSSIGVEEWTTLKLARCSTTMLSCFATFRTVDIASHDGENDWDRGRRTLRGDGRGSSDHDQNVGIVCYQRCRIFVEALVLLRREDLFEHEGPTFDMPEIAGALQLRRIEYTFLFGIAGVPKNNHFWEAGSSSGRGRLQVWTRCQSAEPSLVRKR